MTDRPDEIAERVEGVRKLGSVIGAMRGLASARVRQVASALLAVDAYDATIRAALVSVTPSDQRLGGGESDTLVVFLAEQGFAGAFSERLLDFVPKGQRLCIVGTRGLAVAAESGISPWLGRAMPVHAPAVPRFADTLASDLLAAGSRRIDALFATTDGRPVRQRLFPIESGAAATPPPLRNLPLPDLLESLLAEALNAGLCRAALHAMAAENAARMAAMASAQRQAERMLDELVARQRQIRQESITSEIIELGSGEAAQRRQRKRAERLP